MDDVTGSDTAAPDRDNADLSGGWHDAGRDCINPAGGIDNETTASGRNTRPNGGDTDDLADVPELQDGPEREGDKEAASPPIGNDDGCPMSQDPVMADAADLSHARYQ